MTAREWRDCADPDELAAAVAAGVEVLAMGRAGDFPTANQTADQFAWSLRAGITYQLPPPAPPWPGAVLSGLVDEDGVPTWLAQAGQVRGEQVRGRSDFVWVNNDQMVAHLDTVWVEVRAPRAVPVPETERVQLGVAVVGGLLAICREGGTLDLGRGDVKIHTENGASVASTSESMFTVEIDPDGTVEVLREDGDA